MAWRRGQPYGQDLRDRVLACPGLTLAQAAARFSVSPSYVSKVRARLRVKGDAAPGPQHNHVPARLAPLPEALRAHFAATPDAKLREVRAWLATEHKVRVSHAVPWTAVARLGLTHEKTPARGRAGSRRRGGSATHLGIGAVEAGRAAAGVPG